MTVKYSQLVGQSPDIEVTEPDGSEFWAVTVPLGTSPETYETRYVDLRRVAGARVVNVSTSRVLAITDAFAGLYVTISGSPLADITLTIPANATVAFPVGTLIDVTLKANGGASPANVVLVTPASGVTLNGVAGGGSPDGSLTIDGNYTGLVLHKVATNEWVAR